MLLASVTSKTEHPVQCAHSGEAYCKPNTLIPKVILDLLDPSPAASLIALA